MTTFLQEQSSNIGLLMKVFSSSIFYNEMQDDLLTNNLSQKENIDKL